jgi:predicted type IV restriction endonuclease
MTTRSTSADFVTAFATGWPEQQPDVMVLSLTTHKGVQDFALTKDQALLIAKTMNETAVRLAKPKTS